MSPSVPVVVPFNNLKIKTEVPAAAMPCVWNVHLMLQLALRILDDF